MIWVYETTASNLSEETIPESKEYLVITEKGIEDAPRLD